MANQHYTILRFYDEEMGLRTTLTHSDTSVSSLKVNGKLVLRSNPHNWTHRRQESFVYDQGFAFRGAPTDASQLLFSMDDSADMARLTNEALARFTGKVRKHNASLGVTLGSFGQSRDMIIDRTRKIALMLERPINSAKKLSKKAKRRAVLRDRASDFLEGEFGWVPLVEDIQKSFGALGRSPPDGWIHATARGAYRTGYSNIGMPYGYNRIVQDSGEISCTVGAKVLIDNPNVFLANRLGLLNLPGVAWDLIPWSFVVNMFTNMGQMVNSMTDFVGVTLSNGSSTRTSSITRQDVCFAGTAPGQVKTVGSARSIIHEKLRIRTLGVPTPTFQFRAPELNMELAAIAISLILQKMNRLNRLFGATP